MQNRNVKLAVEMIDAASDMLLAEFALRLRKEETYAMDTICNLLQNLRKVADEIEDYRKNMPETAPLVAPEATDVEIEFDIVGETTTITALAS